MSEAARSRWSLLTHQPAFPAASGLCIGVLLWVAAPHFYLPAIALVAGILLVWLRHYVVAATLLAIPVGWMSASLNSPVPAPQGLELNKPVSLAGTIQRVIPKANRNLYVIDVDSLAVGASMRAVNPFKVAVSDGDATSGVFPGNSVNLTATLHTTDNGIFPGVENYYRNLGVSLCGVLRANSFEITDSRISLAGRWYKSRMYLSALLAESRLSADAYGLLSALMLGLGDDLPADFRENFRLAGAAHVLALSGFHVAFIFAMIWFVLFPMGAWWRLRVPRIVICILSLWAYAMLTGLIPGVVRATIGLSIWLLGRLWGYESDGLNSLCVAVAVIVCVWPFSIFLASLQLSVVAAAGILICNRLFIAHKFKSLRNAKIVGAVIVPFAAVFATAPVLMYYFHSLPLLFLLSNFVAVLVVAPLLWAGVVRIILTATGISAVWFDTLINSSVDIIGKVFQAISTIPGSSVDRLILSPAQVFMLMGAAALALVVITRGSRAASLLWAVPMIFLLCLTPMAAEAEPEAEAVVVYHSGLSTVVVRNGRQAAALMTCSHRALSQMSPHLPASLNVYTRSRNIDILRVTTGNITLGPFERRGDSLFINQAGYSLKDLERGNCYKIY